MILKFYIIAAFLTTIDETWNIQNPRPFPQEEYYIVTWEAKDFYSYKVQDQWILRQYRKTDGFIKRRIRNKYWRKIDGRSKRRN
tara:strand:+ start:291 stop:542 length:252 start_codon:yes stop_codon:yes gene_type:complete